MSKPRTTKEPRDYSKLSADELDRITSQFDKQMKPGEPLTPAMRRKLAAAKRRGRPRVGRGARRVLITVERGLLEQADALARQRGEKRSELIARGLKLLLNVV